MGNLTLKSRHRVICGDSTDPECLERLMQGDLADMVLTDPPYGVSYVGGTAAKLKVLNDNLDESKLSALMKSAFDMAEKHSRPGAYWYASVPGGPLFVLFAHDWICRGIFRQTITWVKDTLVLGRSEYHYQHEPIMFGWKPGGSRIKNLDRTRTTVWHCDRPKRSEEHPTMKPVELWARAICDGSREGDSVLDPFLGSGTTVVAAETTRRRCYGIELSPAYCDVAVARWEELTGQTAVCIKAS